MLRKNHLTVSELNTLIQEANAEADRTGFFSPFTQDGSEICSTNNKAASDTSVADSTTQASRSATAATTTITKKNQDSTAYCVNTSTNSNPLTASGKRPAVGMCAVHNQKTVGESTTSVKPIIAYGTIITYKSAVKIGSVSKSKFDVEDTGDPKFNKSYYWTDLYFGDYTSSDKTAYNNAINYGDNLVEYSYSN